MERQNLFVDCQQLRLSLAKTLEIIAEVNSNIVQMSQDLWADYSNLIKEKKEEEEEEEEMELIPKSRGRKNTKRVPTHFKCPYCEFKNYTLSEVLKHGKQLHKKEFRQKNIDEMIVSFIEQQF